jgi:23S rRNA (guanosine2251-2'-O)-methyltransferase
MKRRDRDFRHSSSIQRAVLPVSPPLHPHQPTARKPDRGSDENPELVFGLQPVSEVVAATPSRIRKLYVKQGAETRFREQIRVVRENGGAVVTIAGDELARMAGSEARHQGVIAALREYSYVPLEEVVVRQPDPLLLLDGVTDPRNLGAVLRAAECAGIVAVVLARDRTAKITPVAIKSSAGAWAHLAVARCGNVAHTLEYLKRQGYWIAAMDPRGDTSLYDLDVRRRLTVVLGSEGRGVREIVRKTADFIVRIPLYGRVTSLNVSVAGAIALFEIGRHRRLVSTPANT